MVDPPDQVVIAAQHRYKELLQELQGNLEEQEKLARLHKTSVVDSRMTYNALMELAVWLDEGLPEREKNYKETVETYKVELDD